MPTSITVVETSTSAPPSANAAIAACFSRGRICPCSSTTRKSRSSVRESRSYSAVAARAWSASDSSTSGHTTKAWRPCRSSSRTRSYARERSRSDETTCVRHRPAPRRQLPQDGDVEVAVGRERQRARDRRGGHVQHVRGEAGRGLAVERAALVDAEAVLLVDHRDGEPVERDRLLDQRVGADQEPQLARAQLAQEVGAAAAGRRPGEQRGRDERARHERLQRGEVLLGERLGGRHQRRLRPVLDGAQHRVQRDHRLARAHLAHQQPLHGAPGGQVGVHGGHRPALVVRGREGQRLGQPAGAQLRRRPEHVGAGRLPPPRAPAQQRELEQEELLEGQPPAAALVVAEVGREQRAAAVGQGEPDPQAGRQRLDDVGEGGTVLAHQRGDLRRGEPLRRRVGGHVARLSTPPPSSARGPAPGSGCAPRTCRGASGGCPGGTCARATAG